MERDEYLPSRRVVAGPSAPRRPASLSKTSSLPSPPSPPWPGSFTRHLQVFARTSTRRLRAGSRFPVDPPRADSRDMSQPYAHRAEIERLDQRPGSTSGSAARGDHEHVLDRGKFLGTLTGSLLAAPLAAEGQQTGTIYRVGVLSGGTEPVSGDTFRSLEDKLRAFGYVEGRNLVVERQYAEGKLDELPRLVAELVRARVDLIVTYGTPATRAAKQATATIPVIFFLAADPVATGLVASMARPGGNLTGFAQGLYILKQVEVLREAVPRLSWV